MRRAEWAPCSPISLPLGYTNLGRLDIDAGQVAVTKTSGYPVDVGDACAALKQAPEGSLAVIFSVDFIEHVDREAESDSCRAARRALRRGGMLRWRTPYEEVPSPRTTRI